MAPSGATPVGAASETSTIRCFIRVHSVKAAATSPRVRIDVRCWSGVKRVSVRHTYCAARLQTLDRGAPVSLYTVSRELGHGSEEMVRRVYSHLGDVRHRAEVVEYRVEQHVDRLGDRLQRLGLAGSSVTGNVTGSGAGEATKNPAETEVTAGEAVPESGRPDSNRRRPAWEASEPDADERSPA